MSPHDRQGIVFQVETDRILDILASEIYDSPHALLRENVQNAYDAILMRVEASSFSLESASIEITLEPESVSVRDNGIGMAENTLRENFWKAGASGKRTPAAERAGVVGTFGIGAMANFGVSEHVDVTTRQFEGQVTLRSGARREELSIQQECIRLEEVQTRDFGPGTLVQVRLDEENRLDVANALDYLKSYVRFLPVPVRFNNHVISQNSWESEHASHLENATSLGTADITAGRASCEATVLVTPTARLVVRLANLTLAGQASVGTALLIQDGATLMGFRNLFGLAPIPSSGPYAFGGFLNAPFLHPTAGREALSRDSIQIVARVLREVERVASNLLADSPAADQNAAFLNYVRLAGTPELGRRVKVRLSPKDSEVPMQELRGRGLSYYTGRDSHVIGTFSSELNPLMLVAHSNPRREVQLNYIRGVLRSPMVPDQPQVSHIFDGLELSREEAAFLIRFNALLIDDYLLTDVEVGLATISHGVEVHVEQVSSGLRILLAKGHPHLATVLAAYTSAPDAFGALVRDFVRMHVYRRISAHVPSATRQGAEALVSRLRRSRELYRYQESDLGSLEQLLADLLSGSATVGEVLRSAGRRPRSQVQMVSAGQVGSIERELPDLGHSQPGHLASLEPAPPIMRPGLDTPMKVLRASASHQSLNGFRLFLGLSDALFRREEVFFREPHSTRIMWAQHRIIYVFTHVSGDLSLYYDIELSDPLDGEAQGGLHLPTTTIVTKRRIFVPVTPELHEAFELVDGVREFTVRFDTV